MNLVVEGLVNLQLSARSVGIFEAFYSSVKPQPLIHYEIPVSPAAKLVSFQEFGDYFAGCNDILTLFMYSPLYLSQSRSILSS